jgi:thiamine pyrophosphokinase
MPRYIFTHPNRLSRLHDELLAAGVVPELVEGDGDAIEITVPDGVAEEVVAAIVQAHDPAKYDAAIQATTILRDHISDAFDTRLAALPGKRFDQLTDQELLYLGLRVIFGQAHNTNIFDTQGVVRPLEEWKV